MSEGQVAHFLIHIRVSVDDLNRCEMKFKSICVCTLLVLLRLPVLTWAEDLNDSHARPFDQSEFDFQFNADPMWRALNLVHSPEHRQSISLRQCLDRYRTIRRLGGWPSINPGSKLQLGVKDARVPLLRWRLIMSGDMDLDKLSADSTYDEILAACIRRFQKRHGLNADGIVGPDTLATLNVSVQTRINQILINMARWRNLPSCLASRYILVNIPAFQMEVVENQQVIHSMRAIVGKADRPTPVMSAALTYLEINPYWNIPQNIARKDILPIIRRDPMFLVRRKIQVFDSWKADAKALDPQKIDWHDYTENYFPFRLRQEPSVTNALGRIKFIFPNRFSVYIHDTPSKFLFDKTRRSFSSGCVRIEKPMELAQYLLSPQRWNQKRLTAKLESGVREVVVLKEAIPVYMVYMTAWTNLNGQVCFFRDLYNRDPLLMAELNESLDHPQRLIANQREKSQGSCMIAEAAPQHSNPNAKAQISN